MSTPTPRGWRLAADTIVELQCGDGQWRPYKAILCVPVEVAGIQTGGVTVTFAPQFSIEKPLVELATSPLTH